MAGLTTVNALLGLHSLEDVQLVRGGPNSSACSVMNSGETQTQDKDSMMFDDG